MIDPAKDNETHYLIKLHKMLKPQASLAIFAYSVYHIHINEGHLPSSCPHPSIKKAIKQEDIIIWRVQRTLIKTEKNNVL